MKVDACRKELSMGFHKVKPIKPINKYHSRFAYEIYVKNKRIAGLWELDAVNVSKGTAIYKKLNCER